MFKRKTFNLVNEEEAKKREQLYNPKRCRWMKYIVIPAIIGFILLLILMNVDFTDRTKTELSTIAAIGSTITGTKLQTTFLTETTLMPRTLEQKTRRLVFLAFFGVTVCILFISYPLFVSYLKSSYNPLVNKAKVVTNSARCRDQGGDHCTILCVDGNLSYLIDDLEDYKPSCRGDLSVILNNCYFPSQKLISATFKGLFYLKSLEITNSDLVEIVDGAFDIPSMSRLKKLTLNTTEMNKLTDKSFVGLKALEDLKFKNVLSFSKFEGVKFLQPLGETFQEVSICQKNNSVAIDPFSWFDGNEKYLSVKRVDLSGNNFANTLTEKTFSNLPAVRELILADCAITELNMKTFVAMMDTLEYLDLSSNALKILNVSTLISKNALRLELHSNEWSCSCENYELIKALQSYQFTYEEEPLCTTPLQLKNVPLRDLSLNCDEEVLTTQTPPISITPSSVETPSSSLTTSSSTTKTIVSTISPVETPDTSYETRPSSSSSSASEETEESEKGDTTNTTTTASITIIPSSPKPSPPAPVNPIELFCKHFNDAAPPSKYTISIRNFDVRFTIRTTSSSSVVLLISNSIEHLRMVFFTANNRTYVTEKSGDRNIPDCHCERTFTSSTMIHVYSLHSNDTYIFCLIPIEEHTMSPFNCQSHHMNGETSRELKAWLLSSDQTWFCIVIIFGIVLNICLGLIAVYWLLHWRPNWLRGCKRIIRAEALSHEVYLLPKPSQKRSEQDESTYDNGRNFDTLHSNMNLDFGSYDYMQFYKDFQDANRNRKIQTLSSILSPKEQAPAVPQNQTRTVSLQSTIPADDLIEQCATVDDNDYQSIDYYEQLF